ncbi:MAG: Flp pilus assembly protein CpaB [Pseudomonadota bacterium]
MRIIAMLFVIVGAVVAGSAIYMLNNHMAQQQAVVAQPDATPQMVWVVVAKRRLEYGHRIHKGNLKTTMSAVKWPKDAVPEGSFSEREELVGEDDESYRVVLRTIEPGELVLQSKVSGFGGSARVATRVSEGMRAFAIPINVVSGVAGLVTPGDHVDILLTRRIDRQMTTSVILQNVLVIAVDQLSNTESDRARVASTATVEVSPTDASKLTLAKEVGRLSLTLRGTDQPAQNVEPLDIGPTQVRDLPDTPEIKAPPVVEAPTEVRLRKGGKLETIQVD